MKIGFFFLFSCFVEASIEFPINSIYDTDDREFISQNSNSIPPQIKQLAKSVALIFNNDNLVIENDQLFIFANLLTERPPIGMNICPDERFSNHHYSRGACTGFLVAEDLIATAGHCFRSQFSCDNKIIAFDIDSNSEISRGFKIDQKNIYRCKEIVTQVYNRDTLEDYTVIKLDRKSERMPLKMRITGTILSTDQVFLIGHSQGLPLIYSPSSKIIDNSNPAFFKSQLDAFHGNSGSPVFNSQTQLVEGILVRGEEDIETDIAKDCQRYIKYLTSSDTDKLKGEGVNRIEYILPFTQN